MGRSGWFTAPSAGADLEAAREAARRPRAAWPCCVVDEGAVGALDAEAVAARRRARATVRVMLLCQGPPPGSASNAGVVPAGRPVPDSVTDPA